MFITFWDVSKWPRIHVCILKLGIWKVDLKLNLQFCLAASLVKSICWPMPNKKMVNTIACLNSVTHGDVYYVIRLRVELRATSPLDLHWTARPWPYEYQVTFLAALIWLLSDPVSIIWTHLCSPYLKVHAITQT